MKNIYQSLSQIKFLSKRYTLKFLFVAFLGIHVPLIAVVTFVCTGIIDMSPMNIILLTLAATLVATGITLYILNGLLWPLHLGRKALDSYLNNNNQPLLPTHYKDEAGILLARIQETIEKLDMLMEDKKDLISLFSHDMRTPTSQMVILSRLIKEEENPIKIKEYTAILEQVAEKQMALLSDILIMLKADHTYNIVKDYEHFQLKEWIEDSINSMQTTAKQKNVHFSLIIDCVNCNIKGDKVMMTEAFINILTNAIKFSYPKGEIIVKAELNNGLCRLEVTDHGMGFQNSISKKLFEKFTRYGKNGTAGEQSTGIGLYLTKTILHRHNASIEAYSKGTDMGATFTIEIPCR